MLLESITSHSVGRLLILGDCQSTNTQEVADAGDNQEGPAEVDDGRKHQVTPEIIQLKRRAHLGKPKARQVSEERTTNKRPQHNGPVREGLSSKMGENHFGSHSAKDK